MGGEGEGGKRVGGMVSWWMDGDVVVVVREMEGV